MSYDIEFGVKVADADGLMATIGEPEFSSPTYNIGTMFRKCMDCGISNRENGTR